MDITNRILIIGMSAAGTVSLSADLLAKITRADLLIGGKRHLSYFPEFTGERLAITRNIDAVAARLQAAVEQGEQAVVLASGDPLCYGMGATLRRWFSAETLEIIPSPTAFQLAFAALGESWHDAKLVSAHGRDARPPLIAAMTHPKVAMLTDNHNRPNVLAARLLDMGIDPSTPCAVCENLASSEQRIVRTTIGAAAGMTFGKLNVFVVWNEGVIRPIAPHLPDTAFSTNANQITKHEIRLLSLAEIGLQANEILWDIGAGSGSVGIEAARSQPSAQVFALEKRPLLTQHLRQNVKTHNAFNLTLIEGVAPDDCHDIPDPDAVFIGGSGGHLRAIIAHVLPRLPVGGRIVANFATIENLMLFRDLLPTAHVIQVNIQRGKPIQSMLRFEALNPVFVVKWVKS